MVLPRGEQGASAPTAAAAPYGTWRRCRLHSPMSAVEPWLWNRHTAA